MGFYSFYFIIKKLKKYRKFIFIVFLVVFLLNLYNTCFAAASDTEVLEEFLSNADGVESKFVSLCYYPYINDTNFWKNELKPKIFNPIINNNYCSYIQLNASSNTSVKYDVHLYAIGDSGTTSTSNYTSRLTGETLSYRRTTISSRNLLNLTFNPSSNTGSVSTVNYAVNYPTCLYAYRSPYLTQFLQDIANNHVDYDNYLNSIKNSLLHIGDINEDILGYLVQISIQISNLNMPDYSTDLSGISSSISSILSDNQSIISQNSSMISQQQQINNNLSNIDQNITDLNDNVQDLNDNIMDDNFDNSNLNLPTNNTQNTADSGINNIFNSMYNAFCTGVAQDIVLPLPFTNKNITIEPDFLYNALYNSNSNWLILFIQAFWGYLIGRFIVLDVNDKFNKIKSGNIENLENSNIKGDLL